MTVLADRVRETTTTTGTGTVTLAGATPGYRAFSAEVAIAGTVFYCITDGTNWETGLGTLATATTLARTTVYESSNAGGLVSFPAGTKDVFCTIPASRFLPVHANIGASVDLDTVIVSGVYHQANNSNTTLVLNYPVALAGKLEVFASDNMVYQTYMIYNSGDVYTRSKYSTTWYGWQKMASVADTDATFMPKAGGTFTAGVAIQSTGSNFLSIGRVDGVASTPYLDFNAGATAVDYDVRLVALSGNGVAGGGVLQVASSSVLFSLGTEALPSLTFTGDTDTGIYSPGANQLSIVTGGISAVDFTSAQNATFNGRVGLNTASTSSIGAAIANFSYADADCFGSRSIAYAMNFGRDDSASIYLEADRARYGAYIQSVVSDQNWSSYLTGVWTPLSAASYGAYNIATTSTNSGAGFDLNGENTLYGAYNVSQSNSDHSVFNRYEAVYGAYNFGYAGGDTGYADNLFGAYNYASSTGNRPTFTGSIDSTTLTITAFANSSTINQLAGGCALEAETGTAVTAGTTVSNQLTSDARTFTVEGSHPSALANATVTVTVPSTTGMKVGQMVIGHPLDANGVPNAGLLISGRLITALTATTMTLAPYSNATTASSVDGCGYTVYWSNYYSLSWAEGGAVGETTFQSKTPSQGLMVGMVVSGVGLPLGTTITSVSVTDGNTLTYTFSNAFTIQAAGTYYAVEGSPTVTATGGASGGDEITFASTNGISKGLMVSGTGVPTGTFVKWRTATSIRLNKNLTSTASGSYAFRIAGKTGTYTVSASQTVASQSILGTALKSSAAHASYNYLNIDYSKIGTGYGSKNIIDVDASSILTTAYGCASEITNNNELGTANGVYSSITNNASGNLTTGYLYRGVYTGTIGTKWGFHLTGELKNYLSGALLVGGLDTAYPPAGTIMASAGILSAGPTSGIGYAAGAGAVVSQSGGKGSSVTVNNVCGGVVTSSEALLDNVTVVVPVANSIVTADDVIILNCRGFPPGSYSFNAASGNGGFDVHIKNISGATRSDTIDIRFAVIKAVSG